MDRRTKIIAAGFGACALYVLISSVVYPSWIEPLLTIDKRIAERQEDLDKLEEVEAEVHLAKLEYRDLLDRVGSFDALKVQNSLRERLNELIARHKLENANTSPSRPQEDKKTHVTTTHVTVTAVGSLESAIGFMKDISALPQLIRIGNVAIYPASSSRKNKDEDRVNIRVPIEIKVLPRQRILDQRLIDVDLTQPEAVVRHEDRDYSPIWTGQHFTKVIPLKPLIANAGKPKTLDVGRRFNLAGRAKGGDGKYKYKWDNDLQLSDPSKPNPTMDTEQAGEFDFTLTVTDASGNSDEATVTIKVVDRRRGKKPKPDGPVDPPERADYRWADGRYLQLRMTLLSSTGDQRLDEVMVFNTKRKETAYYAVGSDFDGGELVGVHPRGGVVHRENAYFVYPIGSKFDQSIPADEAGEFPILQGLANRIREAEPQKDDASAPAAEGKQDTAAGVLNASDATASKEAAAKQAASGTKDDKLAPVPVPQSGPQVSFELDTAASKDKSAKSAPATPSGKRGSTTSKPTGVKKPGKRGGGDPGKAKAAKPGPAKAKTGSAKTKASKPSADKQNGQNPKRTNAATKAAGKNSAKPSTRANKPVGRRDSAKSRSAGEEQ